MRCTYAPYMQSGAELLYIAESIMEAFIEAATRTCERACARAHMGVCAHVCEHARLRACELVPAIHRNSYGLHSYYRLGCEPVNWSQPCIATRSTLSERVCVRAVRCCALWVRCRDGVGAGAGAGASAGAGAGCGCAVRAQHNSLNLQRWSAASQFVRCTAHDR